MNAVLIIDKPAGLTSHDVVNRARRILRERSIGHLGTLDPMATGVLPLVTGNLTRLAQFYTASEKTYEGTIRFGFATDTYDAEGDPTTQPQSVTLIATELESLAAAAKDAGALWISSGVLFLMPSSAKQFLPFLREKFPRLSRQYDSWYAHNAYAPETYRQKIAARMARVKSDLGLTFRPWENLRQPLAPTRQLSLAL